MNDQAPKVEDKQVEDKPKRGRPRKYNYPNKLVCTVTGRTVLTNPSQFCKQLETSGKTQEDYIASYVCRIARSQLKNGTLVFDGEQQQYVKVEAPVRPSGTGKRGRPKGSKNLVSTHTEPVSRTISDTVVGSESDEGYQHEPGLIMTKPIEPAMVGGYDGLMQKVKTLDEVKVKEFIVPPPLGGLTNPSLA